MSSVNTQDKLLISGGIPLSGEVKISGAKNSVLPILAASILARTPLVVTNVPDLCDVAIMKELLQELGAHVSMLAHDEICVNPTSIHSIRAPYELVKKMRASIVMLGPLLARFGEAEVALPGGCAIGSRPVNIHVKGLEAMGASVVIENGYIHAKAPNGLCGTHFVCDTVTVTGTENLMMAAVLAKGETVIKNAAREPEVVDLANCLIAMGARISGAGTATITVEGVHKLFGAEHRVIPDRIVAGTYLSAAIVTQGHLRVSNISYDDMEATLNKLQEAGYHLGVEDNAITVNATGRRPKAFDICTSPHPGLPTDMQAQLMVINCLAEGVATVNETIFENRFMHVPELKRMGANIQLQGRTAICTGVESLQGAPVQATDLRASASLVIAGLAAKGQTLIEDIYHVDRGYEKIEANLRALGARVERISEVSSRIIEVR